MNLFFFLLITLVAGSGHAQGWQPGPGHTQVPIWPGTPPDGGRIAGPETVQTEAGSLVAGKPWVYAGHVSQPTLTFYAPKGKSTGAAALVFPGGGYQILAMDLEGTEVCDWLTSRGIACILLKYRVPGERVRPPSGPYPKSSEALEDAQRAMGLVRAHATEWHVDPHRIGVLGFSAGGHLVAAVSTHFSKRLYAPIDAADRESCRPDFAVAIYPGHLMIRENSFELNPDIQSHLSRETPPTFLLQNEDDNIDGVEQALSYYAGLKRAGVPVEMHLYAQGGHAFGLRPSGLPATRWPELVEVWLRTIGVIPR